MRHGTDVANAAYDFNSSVRRKMIQIYSISRAPNRRETVAQCRSPQTYSYSENTGTIGGTETILNALREIINNPDGVDAINMSIVFRNPYCELIKGNLIPGPCDRTDNRIPTGQAEVTELREMGIPFVVGLDNRDLEVGEVTWPACLDGVVKVGGQSGRIGVGAMDIDLYAKNSVRTNNPNDGNSLAAPRIATALAMLREAVPKSLVEERVQPSGRR